MTLATLTDDPLPRCTTCNTCEPGCPCTECHKPARLPRKGGER